MQRPYCLPALVLLSSPTKMKQNKKTFVTILKSKPTSLPLQQNLDEVLLLSETTMHPLKTRTRNALLCLVVGLFSVLEMVPPDNNLVVGTTHGAAMVEGPECYYTFRRPGNWYIPTSVCWSRRIPPGVVCRFS